MAGPARQLHTQQVHYLRKRINFNDSNIGVGVVMGTLPAGALILTAVTRIITAFNAATTNAINVGTAAGGSQIFTDAATAGQRVETIPALAFAADQDVFVQYAQTGAAATAGQADIVVTYTPNNDL